MQIRFVATLRAMRKVRTQEGIRVDERKENMFANQDNGIVTCFDRSRVIKERLWTVLGVQLQLLCVTKPASESQQGFNFLTTTKEQEEKNTAKMMRRQKRNLTWDEWKRSQICVYCVTNGFYKESKVVFGSL